MCRQSRKNDHIRGALKEKPGRADFSDIHLLNNCLPGLDLAQVSLETHYMGRTFSSPFYINALTGGTVLALKVNASLARVAALTDLPMAVGSQTVALETESLMVKRSFKIARRLNPKGQIWANLSAKATLEQAREAVKMIGADALQIHLNAPQELAMLEGDRSFAGELENIAALVKSCQVPVIVKETGFGLAAEEAKLLLGAGVRALDISGRGGTNFVRLENMRLKRKDRACFEKWGPPTALSLIEALWATEGKIDILASGGLYHPLDAAKALALGAKAVGLAGMPLYVLLKNGRFNEAALLKMFRKLKLELKKIMLLAGAENLAELRNRPRVITGLVAQWLESRGIESWQ